jgi:hypothetical protein
MMRLRTTVFLAALMVTLAGGARASHHHRHHHQHGADAPAPVVLDLSPVVVQPYVVPVAVADPARASFLRRMNLENGAEVRSTRWIANGDITTRNLFVLSVTQSLEGGFDSVNVYDRGVLSWGIMQWTAGTGSLQPALVYVKRRLLATGQARVWNKVFVAQGLDVDRRGLIAYGKPLLTDTDVRLAFRGSAIRGNYDPKIVRYWATVFARAGRQTPIQRFQAEYAAQVVDKVLSAPLPSVPFHAPGRAATVASLSGHDPYAEALAFALWTNNPRHAREYMADAARAARHVGGSDDPTLWPFGIYRAALSARCQAGQFSNWRQRADALQSRAALLRTSAPGDLSPFERACQRALAARKAHLVLLASRHRAAARTHPSR